MVEPLVFAAAVVFLCVGIAATMVAPAMARRTELAILRRHRICPNCRFAIDVDPHRYLYEGACAEEGAPGVPYQTVPMRSPSGPTSRLLIRSPKGA